MNHSLIFEKYGASTPTDSQTACEGMRSRGNMGTPAIPGEVFTGKQTPDPNLAGRTGGPIGYVARVRPTWWAYPAVVALFQHLKDNPYGIKLAVDDIKAIHMLVQPGASPRDPVKWNFFSKACALLMDARSDLHRLLASGEITLPMTERDRSQPVNYGKINHRRTYGQQGNG